MKKNGFTLIELLVVISIIGVLTALLLANFVGIRERASDSKRKNDVTQLKSALRLYYNDYQRYPGDSGTSTIVGCGSAGATACNAGTFATTGSTYMKELPEISVYDQRDSGDGFIACTLLQNEGDTAISESQTKCGYSSANEESSDTNYCVCND